MRARPRVRVRVKAPRARARAKRYKSVSLKPLSEQECLELVGQKGLTAWDMLKFLYDCIKRSRR